MKWFACILTVLKTPLAVFSSCDFAVLDLMVFWKDWELSGSYSN